MHDVFVALLAAAVGAGATIFALRLLGGSSLDAARRERAKLLDEANRDAEATRREAGIEAREQAVKLRADLESELRERRSSILTTASRDRKSVV